MIAVDDKSDVGLMTLDKGLYMEGGTMETEKISKTMEQRELSHDVSSSAMIDVKESQLMASSNHYQKLNPRSLLLAKVFEDNLRETDDEDNFMSISKTQIVQKDLRQNRVSKP